MSKKLERVPDDEEPHPHHDFILDAGLSSSDEVQFSFEDDEVGVLFDAEFVDDEEEA